jgi:hypothetical protein
MKLVGMIYLFCALVVIAVLAGGCAPILSAESAAPPARQARLDEVNGFWGNVKSYRLELSSGVALAMTCHQGGPCTKMVVVSDDPKIAEVRTASIGTLERAGMYTNATSTALVVVGKAPGTTKLHLRTGKGGKHDSREIVVTIVAPPQPSPAAKVAN